MDDARANSKPVLPKSELAKKEEEILEFWRVNKIFEQTLAQAAPRGDFVFYEGPPTANGRPGLHHLEARAFKDVIPRFRTMRGCHVRRKAGWDTHGLPVELEVEKELGLKSKKEIEDYGIAAFNARCRESVWKYRAEWERFTERIGFWLDQKDPYVTYEPGYMESVWWALKQVSARNLLYRDYKVLPWCPRCGTALSSHELAQGYREVRDQAIFVKFKVKNPTSRGLPPNTFLVAWTTTPWTLPGNVALAVGEKVEYELFEHNGEHLIASPAIAGTRSSVLLAFGSARPSSQLSPASPIDRQKKQIPATQLAGLEYEPLFDFPELRNAQSHQVYAADFVSTGEGTGIVHTAVMYGADDFTLGSKVGLPKHHLVGEDGRFLPETPWAGEFVKDANGKIIADLQERGLLFHQEAVTHSYPFCWRCKTPLIYYARDSWYIKMSSLGRDLLHENEKVNWEPAHIKNGRFGEWLAEVKDWAISRERYWGTPLPIWESSDKKQRLVIGSLEELKKHTKKSGNKYFVMRHGEAESNAQNLANSKDDPPMPLTKGGEGEARIAAEKLKKDGVKVDKIFCSPLSRTHQTAKIAAQVFGLPASAVVVDERLVEINVGEFHNRPVEDYRRALPTYANRYRRRPAGGESLVDVRRRLGSFLYELERSALKETILIVTHEYPAWMLAAVAGGADEPATIALRDEQEDFIKTSEIQPLDFTPLPHNEDYELDLHRPFIDELVLVDDSGAELRRAPEVLDVWFDSGAMPFAQDNYPTSGKEILYPADFISEAIDQTRGWFYTLLAIGVLIGRGAPYKNVICLGHLLDRQGKKMSKSVGNVVDPWLAMDRYGADALRYFMYTVNAPGESKNFDERAVAEVVKKVINPLLNVLSFYQLYPSESVSENVSSTAGGELPPLDAWLTALEQELVLAVTADLENYRVTEAARRLRDFIADLSQWYLRRSRERLRRGEGQLILRAALRELAIIVAPFMPFLAERIFQTVRQTTDPLSVHLMPWPNVAGAPDGELLRAMSEVRRLASLALEARDEAKIKVRQPLSRLTLGASVAHLPPALLEILRDEVNVKEVAFDEKQSTPVLLETKITPDLATEGERREIIRALQAGRKAAGLRPGEPARLTCLGSEEFRSFIEGAPEIATTAQVKEVVWQAVESEQFISWRSEKIAFSLTKV